MRRLPLRMPRLSREAQLAVLAVAAFIGMTIWWLTQDDRVQDWDNGLHTMAAFAIKNEIAATIKNANLYFINIALFR